MFFKRFSYFNVSHPGVFCMMVLALGLLSACGESVPNQPQVSETKTEAEAETKTEARTEANTESGNEARAEAGDRAGTENETESEISEELTGLGFGELVSRRTGDLDMMKKERTIRVLTVYGMWSYYINTGEQKGVVYDVFKQFETHINDQLKEGEHSLKVVMVPVARDQLLTGLVEGRGDIAAAALIITPEREKLVDFSDPVSRDISEILVTGPSAPEVKTLDDLGGQTVHVRASSSFGASLDEINQRLVKEGKKPIHFVDADVRLDQDDLLEMVNSGLMQWAVVSNIGADVWAKVFDKLKVRQDIVFHTGEHIGYAVRKDSPLLLTALNNFVKTHKQGTLAGNMLINRNILEASGTKNAISESDYQQFEELTEIFQKYGQQYEIDHLLLTAQGYQESGLDQTAKSHTGAIGIMQLLPSTAKGNVVNIPDISTPENNIHAGAKYMDYLRDRYFSDPEMDQLNQMLFTFAAYNAGPAKVRDLRAKTAQIGYDSNIWFDNVEYTAAKEIGHETVQYVSNILKYYIAYTLAMQKKEEYIEARDGSGIN